MGWSRTNGKCSGQNIIERASASFDVNALGNIPQRRRARPQRTKLHGILQRTNDSIVVNGSLGYSNHLLFRESMVVTERQGLDACAARDELLREGVWVADRRDCEH
jgi:hypothetical protein